MIEFLNQLDMPSVYFGFISCMVFDVFFALANWILQAAWENGRLRKRIKELEALNDNNLMKENEK